MHGSRISFVGCFLVISLILVNSSAAQSDEVPFRIGVVLSGGGAKGAAHVGFLQALEEAGIVPDFIVGTSVGALVGGYYAAGWSPMEMKAVLATEAFEMRVKGIAPWEFGFKQRAANPSFFEVKLATGGGLLKGNLISSLPMDWALMEELGPADGYARGRFDQLLVPFRSVASDVVMKQDSVFSRGNLAMAIRASIAFPFYLKPVWMDGKPLYDGGLYNNFPLDVMEEEFHPDFIIGCRVVDDVIPLESDDLAIQIEAMVSRLPKSFEPSHRIVVIEPQMEVGTFDFNLSGDAVAAGVQATTDQIPQILSQLLEQGWRPDSSLTSMSKRRNEFRQKLPAFQVGQVSVRGLKMNQQRYVESLVLGRVAQERTESVKRNLFLLASDEHIGDVRPSAAYDDSTGLFNVLVNVREERDLALEAGGNVSSRPVSFGYASARYSRFGRVPMTLKFSSSFGSLYSAASLDGRFDFHGTVPWAVQPYYLLHRWNYVRSFSTFFQDVRPSFLVANEVEYGLRWLIPTGNRSVFEIHQARLKTTDFTYPDWEFNPSDTTDVERFSGWVVGVDWGRNALDSKQFARRGNARSLKIKRFEGSNESVFESHNPFISRVDSTVSSGGFYRLAADVEQYVTAKTNRLSLGFKGMVRLSDEGVRSTYRSTLVQATPMEPMPGAKSLFLEKFRGFNFVGLGAVIDVGILGSALRWRTECHGMFSWSRLVDSSKGPSIRGNRDNRFMAGTWLVSESQVGLFSLGAEYYQDERNPLLVEFSWGYRLFQASVRR
jgi:NTE family protein